MINTLRNIIPDRHPARLLYHKLKAMLACIIYRFPANKIEVIGVTGTKGKTTTTNLIAAVLQEAGYKVGLASTTGFQVGESRRVNESKMTTLSPFFLQKLLREMVDDRCQIAVLETSSHSLTQNRVWGVNYDMGVLTNMGQDHLEYHGGFEAYLQAKGLLFAKLNRAARKPKIQKISVLNQDDVHFAYFDQFLADRKYSYGLKGGTCYAKNIKHLQTGTNFDLHVPNHHINITLKLPGEFNVYNAVAAAAVALAHGINLQVVKSALEKASPIPGRYEQVDAGQPFAVIVDYAHTAESLGKLLELYKNQTPGRLFAVFGATGGGRDKAKRPEMGKVADQFSDVIILTDDDPYVENEWQIIEDIAAGIQRDEGQNFWKIPNRYQAIRYALTTAKAGDTVVIAGKGAETVQMIRGKRISWDDRKVVREILGKALEVEL